jgi:hypothetical protein
MHFKKKLEARPKCGEFRKNCFTQTHENISVNQKYSPADFAS